MRVQSQQQIIGLEEVASVGDFWEWAFSDLCDDDIKGWYAEWIVGRLLGLPMTRRISWANSDLITSAGVRIEVKASAYWQSWKLLDEFGSPRTPKPFSKEARKKVRFAGLRSADSVLPGPRGASFKSHLYVFAFQNETDPMKWNALDLSQWEFYMLPVAAMPDCASISLVELSRRTDAMSAMQLRDKGRSMLTDAEGHHL